MELGATLVLLPRLAFSRFDLGKRERVPSQLLHHLSFPFSLSLSQPNFQSWPLYLVDPQRERQLSQVSERELREREESEERVEELKLILPSSSSTSQTSSLRRQVPALFVSL